MSYRMVPCIVHILCDLLISSLSQSVNLSCPELVSKSCRAENGAPLRSGNDELLRFARFADSGKRVEPENGQRSTG